jgi:hypothetical protein
MLRIGCNRYRPHPATPPRSPRLASRVGAAVASGASIRILLCLKQLNHAQKAGRYRIDVTAQQTAELDPVGSVGNAERRGGRA